MLKFICVLSLLLVIKANVQEITMHDENTDPYQFFTSRTPYRLVASQYIDVPDGYTAHQIFTVNRHGTSYPDKYFFGYILMKITDFITKYGSVITQSANLCDDDKQSIVNWISNQENPFSTGLHEKGQIEIKELAKRVQKAFPSIFDTPFNHDDYHVQSLPDERCEKTGQIFIQTVFNNNDKIRIPVCGEEDKTLIHNNILKYDAREITNYIDLDIQQQKIIRMSEIDKFKSSNNMLKVVQNVRDKLGLGPEWLDHSLVFYMYELCTYETSIIENTTSIWCKVFSNDDLEVLEYVEEMYMYNSVGYGNPFNIQLATPMASRLLQTLKKKVRGKGPKGVFHFVKLENILSMYVTLGLAKGDGSMKSGNFDENLGVKNLKWRTSKLGPRAANFMAVLLKNNENEHFVSFYFNEHRASIKMMDGSYCEICHWYMVEEKLEVFQDTDLFSSTN